MGENVQLLQQMRDRVLTNDCAERKIATKDEWNEWKDVQEWALLSEGGHHTSPHMDSHGFGTWLTAQEGEVGFGWMSRPTEEEFDGWLRDPEGSTRGSWRFVVLRAGDTVFFNSGTIHFVFRVQDGQTMILGGHVLQWSNINRWIDIINKELEHPAATNEDMEGTVCKYVRLVGELVTDRLAEGSDLAARGILVRFLTAVKDFEARYGRAGLSAANEEPTERGNKSKRRRRPR